MIAPSRTVHRRRRRRPGRAAARIVPPELALDEHLNPERTDSIMRFVKLYLGQGFFEILVAAQDATSPPAPDATGSQEAGVPTWNSRMLWQFGESRARNLRYLLQA